MYTEGTVAPSLGQPQQSGCLYIVYTEPSVFRSVVAWAFAVAGLVMGAGCSVAADFLPDVRVVGSILCTKSSVIVDPCDMVVNSPV